MLDLNDTLDDLDTAVKKLEDKMALHEDLGPDARDARHLDKIQVYRRS